MARDTTKVLKTRNCGTAPCGYGVGYTLKTKSSNTESGGYLVHNTKSYDCGCCTESFGAYGAQSPEFAGLPRFRLVSRCPRERV